VSVSGCLCFKRDMAVNPRPFVDNFGTANNKQACGCIESASTGK